MTNGAVWRIGYICNDMSKPRLYLSVVFMLLAIVAVAAFQIYWLSKNFREEKQDLSMRMNMLFRFAMEEIHTDKILLDSNVNSDVRLRVARYGDLSVLNALKIKKSDTPGPSKKRYYVFPGNNTAYADVKLPPTDSIHDVHVFDRPDADIVKVLNTVDSLQDSISIKELTRKYEKLLKDQNISIPFSISKYETVLKKPRRVMDRLDNENELTLGFKHPVTYRVDIENKTAYVLGSMWSQFVVSLMVVGLTVLSFALLLRSLVQQRKLTQIKNDFISNITHELKTPIATVSVAIEALRSFDALHDPQRTKEYLAISSNELQRLSFLVDKVLKLSMFEKHQIELKAETIDLAQLVNEVVSSMKLQLEKYKAQVNVQLHGHRFIVNADKLHMTSVLFNLLDNALKYSRENPSIHIELKEEPQQIQLAVTDNGIGIAAEYRKKIFDKFFRVPAGNTHNVKGYGLGLSYVAYVIQRHNGSIDVESQPGIGSRFIVKLPAQL
jgi:two-component system phosphate regulon sensor histidine kinase PhoR